MASLYDLALEAKLIEDELISGDGELTPELEQRIDALLSEGPDKFDAAASVLRRLKALGEECKAESDRLSARRASFLKAHDGLKHRMLGALLIAFKGKLKTARNTFYVGRSAARRQYECGQLERLELNAPELVKITKALDTKAAEEWLKKEGDLPAEITVIEVEGTEFLGIR